MSPNKFRPQLLGILLVTALAPAASAKPKPLAAILGELRWGDTVERVQSVLKKKIDERYKKLLDDTQEPLEQRELRERLAREVGELLGAYTKFDGQKTALEVGVVGEEFRHGTGESVLAIRSDKGDRYYFFIGGK